MKKHFLFGFLFFCVLSSASGQYGQPLMMGKALSLQPLEEGILITAETGKMLIRFYAPDIIRIRIAQKDFSTGLSYAVIRSPELQHSGTGILDRDTYWEISSGSIILKIFKNPLRLVFLNHNGEVLNEDYASFPVTWQGTEVTAYKKLFPDEKFIGLGEKTGNLNRRGDKFEMWNSDVPAYALNEDPIYVSIPFYMGIHGKVVYGIFLDNTFRTMFDFAASTDNLFTRFSATEGELNYYFFGSSTIAGIIEDYTWLTGRMTMPPLWSLGYQQCRWGYYPDTEVMSLARKFRDKRIPCDVIYLDIDYMDGYKIFTWHPERFPQPKVMLDELKRSGFHVVTIVDPGIKIEPGYFAYDEGVENGYFAKYPDGSYYTGTVWPGRCHFPDFTSEKVRSWWGRSFDRLTEPGIEGFWNDMNEPAAWGQNVPDIVQFNFEGRKGSMAETHNIYGMNMAKSTYEGTKALMKGKRPFVLTRAGYAGIQRYSAVWTGDNEATDDHMLLGVRLVNSMGLSGISFAGPDLGGFIGQPSKDLYQRWLTLGVFTPFFRNHSAVDTKDKEPWSFGEDGERFSKKWISLRYKLIPYIYSAFYQSTLNGMPVERSLAIDYTFDEKIWLQSYQHQYLFGDNILVAPVSCTQQYAKIYLPDGGWYRMSTGSYYEGGSEVIVDAPLNDLPVFVKASGIIPMQSVVQYTAEKPSDTLDLHVYRGDHASDFLLYEDDGGTYEYEKGQYRTQHISYHPEDTSLLFGDAEGGFPSRYPVIRIIPHGFRTGQTFTVPMPEKSVRYILNRDQ